MDALAENQARARRLALVPAVAIEVAVTAVAVALVVAVGLVWAAPVAILLGAVATFATAAAIGRQAPGVVLATIGGRVATEAEEPRLHNLVEGLCVGIGLTPPRIHLLEDDVPNALVVARSVDDADLVVTRGLLTGLSLVELEAVLAHELARIRRGEAVVGALAAPTLGASRFPSPLFVLVGLVAPITRAVAGRGEPVESWSDLAAVDITRYPPALASALATLATADPALPSGAPPAVAHLWIHGARAEGAFGAALAQVYEPAPPVADRIEVLEEL